MATIWLLVFANCFFSPPPAPMPFGDPPQRGEILINELMINPGAVADRDGEYIELWNVASHPVQLLGLVVRDERRDWCPIDVPLVIPPGEYLVLLGAGTIWPEADVLNSYTCPERNLTLANKSDAVVLDWYGEILDDVVWQGKAWRIPAGASLELDPMCADDAVNDNPGAWFPALSTMESGDKGTPGRRNR